MSRGRGGGGGGFRGGRSKPGTARIGGIDITYDEALEENLKRPQPEPLFPPREVQKPSPLTERELAFVAHTLRVRERFRSGPLYTSLPPADADRLGIGSSSSGGFGGGSGIRSSGGGDRPKEAGDNPFENMPTYSHRYFNKSRTLPLLKAHWKVHKQRRKRIGERKLYPRELWKVMGFDTTEEDGDGDGDGDEAGEGRGAGGDAGSRMMEEAGGRMEGVVSGEVGGQEGGGGGESSRSKRKKRVVGEDSDAEDVEEGGEKGEKGEKGEEDEEVEEEIDDAFDTDEEDMGGDYNAEAYFDDGDEEVDDDDGGGGGDYYD